jgi:hypothetical protein
LKNALVIACCFVLVIAPLWGQVPGYAGRTWSVMANFSAFPRINLNSQTLNVPRVQSRIGLDVNKVLSRQWETGCHLEGIYSKIAYDYGIGRPRVAGNAWLRGINTGLHLHYYTFLQRGNLAPLGINHELRADYIMYQLTDIDRNFYQDKHPDLGHFQDFGLSYGISMSRVWDHRWRYVFGMNTGWVFKVFPDPDDQEATYLRSIALNRLRGYYTLNIFVRVGGMLPAHRHTQP